VSPERAERKGPDQFAVGPVAQPAGSAWLAAVEAAGRSVVVQRAHSSLGATPAVQGDELLHGGRLNRVALGSQTCARPRFQPRASFRFADLGDHAVIEIGTLVRWLRSQ